MNEAVFLVDVDNTLLDIALLAMALFMVDYPFADLDEVERRYPANHYILVDDKLRILAAVKKIWGERLTTVFVRQGKFADPKVAGAFPPADLAVERIANLLDIDRASFTLNSIIDNATEVTA